MNNLIVRMAAITAAVVVILLQWVPTALGLSTAAAGDEQPPLVIRVGFVANESELQERLTTNYGRFQRLEQLCEQEHAQNPAFPLIHFRIASGGYNDIYHWARQGLIDFGILSPGVYAAVQRDACPLSRQGSAWEPLGIEDRAEGTGTYFYRSTCVVPTASPIHTWRDLVDAIKDKNRHTELLFADPLSLSGYLAPMHALAQPGLSLDWQDLAPKSVFMFSHDRPLRYLTTKRGESAVAFVREQEVFRDHGADGKERARKVGECPELFRVIEDFPALNRLSLQHATVAVRSDLPQMQKDDIAHILHIAATEKKSWLTTDLAAAVAKRTNNDSLIVTDETIRRWQADPVYQRPSGEDVSLRELAFLLEDYYTHPRNDRPLRIALCLSGGGAKCAYQVGAVCAVENKLWEMRADMLARGMDPEKVKAMDIGLVVGTSGGAINAVPVAMGLTRPIDGLVAQPATTVAVADGAAAPKATTRRAAFDDRQMLLVNTWAGLKKWQIVQLWSVTESALSAWTAALVVWLTLFGCVTANVCRSKWGTGAPTVQPSPPAKVRWLPWRTRIPMIVAAAFVLVGVCKHWSGSAVSAWLWFGPTFWYKAALMSLAFGLFVASYHHVRRRRQMQRLDVLMSDRNLTLVALVLQVSLSVVLVWTTATVTPSLLTSEGIERELAGGYGTITKALAAEDGATFPFDDRAPVAAQFAQISTRILDPRTPLVRNRDLVLTVSNVQCGPDMPMNFYAYVAAGAGRPTPGLNWIDMNQRRGQLLDFVIGSGSIFPMFPARRVETAAQKLELVDGGFAHNSPIEAAVLWDATHIIQIEASPDEDHPSGSLLTNAGVAYNHLFSQAQDSDARAKDAARAIVFRIRPSRTINLVDFDHDRLLCAARRGFSDALGHVPQEKFDPEKLLYGYQPPLRAFRREPTVPDFVDVKLPSPTTAPTTG